MQACASPVGAGDAGGAGGAEGAGGVCMGYLKGLNPHTFFGENYRIQKEIC